MTTLRLNTVCLVALCMVASADAKTRKSAAKRKTLIIAIGDSTTAGTPFFRSPLEAPPNGDGDPQGQYAYWMMRKRPQWRVLNFGVSGQNSDQIRARFLEALKRYPRYIVILAGVNDLYQGIPVSATMKNLLWMYQQAQTESVMPVAATVPPFSGMTVHHVKELDELNQWIHKSADRMRIPIADLNLALRDPRNPYRLNGTPDGLHPDVGGYRKMGLVLIEAIDPIEKAWR